MAFVVMVDRLSSAAIPSRATAGGGSGFDFGGGLDGSCVCVAAAETAHEGRLGGSGLDHVVVAAGMHGDGFVWSSVLICGFLLVLWVVFCEGR